MKCLKMRQSKNTCIAQPIQTAYIIIHLYYRRNESKPIVFNKYVHFDVSFTKKTLNRYNWDLFIYVNMSLTQETIQWLELRLFHQCGYEIPTRNYNNITLVLTIKILYSFDGDDVGFYGSTWVIEYDLVHREGHNINYTYEYDVQIW